MSLGTLIRTSPLATVGIFLLGGVFSALYAMSSVYATQRGLSVRDTSWFITAIFLGGLVFQYPIGWLSDRIDRRVLIIGATGVGALAALIAATMGDRLAVLLATALVLGGMAGPLYSLLVAYANDYLETDQMAAASGGLLFINGFGAMSGPIIFGMLMSRYGIEWFFYCLVALLSAICLYGLFRTTRRPHTVIDEPAPYLPISSRTGLVATEMGLAWADETRSAEEEARAEGDDGQRDADGTAGDASGDSPMPKSGGDPATPQTV